MRQSTEDLMVMPSALPCWNISAAETKQTEWNRIIQYGNREEGFAKRIAFRARPEPLEDFLNNRAAC